MTRKQIEKEIDVRLEEPDNEWDGIFNSGYSRGFRDGAQWRINSVWHDANEKPDKNQLVVFECRKTYGCGYSVNFGENYDLLKNVVLKWAYVIDLLPERKEVTE